MRIEQVVRAPCAMCQLVSQMSELSEHDKRVYQLHLWREHGIKPYFIHR